MKSTVIHKFLNKLAAHKINDQNIWSSTDLINDAEFPGAQMENKPANPPYFDGLFQRLASDDVSTLAAASAAPLPTSTSGFLIYSLSESTSTLDNWGGRLNW